MAPATLGTATVAAYVTSVFAAAFVLAPGGAPPRRGPSRVVFVPRETPRGLDIDTLTKWEADYVGGHVTRRPPRLGRECGSYRWTQDAEHVYVTIPLPGRPPSANDVSMVVSQEEFALDIIFPRREFTGVRGPLAGSVSVPKSRWEFADDPVDGPALEVTLEKTGPATDFVEWWGAFLLSETPAPVVQFKGIDAATGARFQQHLDTFDIELDVPRDVEPRDVRVDVDPTGWRVRVRRGGFDDDALFFEEDDEDVLLFEEDALPVEEEDDDDDDLENSPSGPDTPVGEARTVSLQLTRSQRPQPLEDAPPAEVGAREPPVGASSFAEYLSSPRALLGLDDAAPAPAPRASFSEAQDPRGSTGGLELQIPGTSPGDVPTSDEGGTSTRRAPSNSPDGTPSVTEQYTETETTPDPGSQPLFDPGSTSSSVGGRKSAAVDDASSPRRGAPAEDLSERLAASAAEGETAAAEAPPPTASSKKPRHRPRYPGAHRTLMTYDV
mmetsp:Transcript_10037/g.40714  ORF Transcript_10037/g.40714 Transcript_10037/m.40714 type:complete len:496 (-) Transcript_10037:162-1649(-)